MKKIGDLMLRFRNRLGKATELQSFESFSMLLDADGTLTFTGERSIDRYTDEEIIARFPPRRVFIRGKNLFLFELAEKEMSVCGKIGEIRFETGGAA